MSVAWALKRLTTMGGREILFRVRRAAQAQLECLGVGLATVPEPSDRMGHAWVEEISRQFDSKVYIAAADRVMSGKFDLFAMRPAELGFPPRWNRDPRTGIDAPLAFGKTLNYRNEALVGDIKYLWELNRHLELVTLAQAWHITRQPKYAHACCELLQSWFDQCPYPRGPNWTSSLEHGIRLVNWAVAWHLLQTWPMLYQPERQQFLARWRSSIYQHCHFIVGHRSYYSSANNHLLGELAGLLVAALTWPSWRESQTWATLAHRQFEEQCLLQTFPDGVNREQATWYHHSVADMMLIVGLFARANNADFSAAYWQRLESMLDFLASIMDVAGHVPAFGDADDAVLVRFCAGQSESVYRSLLSTGAVLYRRPDLQAKGGIPDDKSRWLMGDEKMLRSAGGACNMGRLPVRKAFPDGGYYVLGDRFEASDEMRIVADAGPLGYLTIAAHGHADALSLTLSYSGVEFLVDSGTYAYHTQKKWREYFRGTSAHNVMRVDRTDQSMQIGSFMWGRRALVRNVVYQSDESGDMLSAVHDGYASMPGGGQVARMVKYDRETKVVTIVDELHATRAHHIEIFWHFAEDCIVTLEEETVVARCGGRTLTLTWPDELAASLIRGEENPPLGWRSKSYDVRLPIYTLLVFGSVNGNWQGTTTIETGCH